MAANLLPMDLYILAGHNFHILICYYDLPIVTNALCLLPMYCQFAPIIIGKTFVKNIGNFI